MLEYIQSPHFQQLLEQHPDYILVFLVFVFAVIGVVAACTSNWFKVVLVHNHYHTAPPAQYAYPPRDHAPRHVYAKQDDNPDEWPMHSPAPSRRSRRSKRPKMDKSKRFRILRRDGFRCQVCGRKASEDDAIELHIDHKMPLSQGGSNDDSNLWTLCKECNLGKSDQIIDELIKSSDGSPASSEREN